MLCDFMKKEKFEILRKLMHSEGMSFNKLWFKDCESNNFTYHLKALCENGLVEKGEDLLIKRFKEFYLGYCGFIYGKIEKCVFV